MLNAGIIRLGCNRYEVAVTTPVVTLITYPRMIVLGIDAGGTKTVCQVADGDGAVLAESRGPGANLVSIGEQRVESALRAAIDSLLADRRIGRIGSMRCASAWPASIRRAKRTPCARVLSRIGHFGQTLVVSDSLIALEAGAPDSPGVVVATGTGSIAYGRDAPRPRGTRRADGDTCSPTKAAGTGWARRRCAPCSAPPTAAGPATALTGPVLRHFGVGRPQDVGREVYRDGVRPAAIAELATVVETAAADGDHVALDILERGSARAHACWQSRSSNSSICWKGRSSWPAARSVPRHVWRRTWSPRSRSACHAPRLAMLDVEPAYGAVRLAIALLRGELRVPAY